jgi:nitrite reductase/ring-hydroxylating ferredoxin subunit
MNATPSSAETTEVQENLLKNRITRAGFLSLAGKSLLALCGLLGLGGLVTYLSFQPDPAPPTLFDLGDASNYPPGSRTVIADARAVVLHTDSGYSAKSLVCPHLGCTVALAPAGYACPCHGSRFNLDGSVRNGPASQPMKVLTVEVTPDGKLILHTA